MFDWVVDPISRLLKFFEDDIYQFFVDAFAYLVEQLTLGSIKFMIWSMQFGWDVAEQIILDLGLNDKLNQAWGLMDNDTISILSFFGIPEVVSILLSAIVTSYVLKFIPFSGK